MDVVPYAPEWLPALTRLARAHACLVPPSYSLSEGNVVAGLERHSFWPFYSAGLASAQTLVVVEGNDLLAAAQAGFVAHGWGYGAAWGDGPEWLFEPHVSLLWLLCWPGDRRASEAAAQLAARVVGWVRGEGLPGVEAFRGGPGFLPFGTQLSSRWLHLWEPLRAAGFRQPRALLVYSGETDPEALPATDPPPGLSFRERRGRLEAWLDGAAAGVSVARQLELDEPEEPSRTDSDKPKDEEPAQNAASPPAWAVLRRLVVDEALRGQGIGSALLAEQLRRLDRRGIARYLLHVPDAPEELPARCLYAKFGALLDRQYVLRVSF